IYTPQAPPQCANFPAHVQQVLDTCSTLTRRIEHLEHDNVAQKLAIIKLKARVKRLEWANQVKSSKLRRLRKVGASSATISAAKPSIPAAAPTVVAAYTRRRKGVIIRDPKEELSLKTPAETPKLKDKGKGILVETPKPVKKKDQIELNAEYARKLHEEINKDHEEINKDIDWDATIDHTESEARKNMIAYLKNTNGFKMDFFKGMSYDEIRLIFQSRFDANMRFLLKSREEMKEEDQELEIVNDEDDDVFTEATPLGRKVPVVNYEIVLINNKPRYKIIKADETHQLYISFITLLKNFDREDLEDLWRIVKERFSTSKPSNFSDDYLLSTLKTMFEKPDGQDAVWRNQNSVYGQALLLELMLSKRSKKNTKCVNAVDEELTPAKLKLKKFKNIAAADVK
nr:hypothetical protein [Tanacetum cinerariifolium]